MKRAIVVMLLLALPVLSVFHQEAFAAEPSNLIAVHSTTAPTIDGRLNSSEWWDAARYKVNVTGTFGDIETWLYFKHNHTFLYIGFVVWQISVNAYDQFAVIFDEGDDGGYGSGSRDFALMINQEDLKTCTGANVIRDGCYKAGPPPQFYAFDVEIDFDAKTVHENDHATEEWEIEYWEGLLWVDDHWECEFSIPLVGNDGATQDVSDLVCAVGDTIGFKTQYFINPGTKNYYYPAGSIDQIATYANLTLLPPCSIESCDALGAKKDGFSLYEDVHVNGSDFSPATAYDFYIVNDVETWTDGASIPARVVGTATSVVSDPYGNIFPATVWVDPATVGQYDMIVDVNGNGLYDAEIDALDNNDVNVTAGFVVPEFASAVLLALLMILSTLCIAIAKKNQLGKSSVFIR